MRYLTENQRSKIKQKINLNNGNSVVRLDYMGLDDPGRNVYCINEKNEVVWQIENDLERIMLPGGLDFDSFTYVAFDGQHLTVNRFSEFKCEVNVESGKIKVQGWRK